MFFEWVSKMLSVEPTHSERKLVQAADSELPVYGMQLAELGEENNSAGRCLSNTRFKGVILG